MENKLDVYVRELEEHKIPEDVEVVERVEVDEQMGGFKIMRPVKPTGITFIRYIYGYISKNVEGFAKYKRDWSKLITKLGYKIEDKIGDKWMICSIDYRASKDGKPKKLVARDIVVLEEKKVEGVVEV